jgi:crotonobetainyl-CoA:carnitine CoA-transferase CaiB-like acyl-CoA transferase
MAAITRKSPANRASAQKLAARKAEQVAKVLQSFAATLNSLDEPKQASRRPTLTARNWWKAQAGRFRDDPTFPEFVAQVQAARRREG